MVRVEFLFTNIFCASGGLLWAFQEPVRNDKSRFVIKVIFHMKVFCIWIRFLNIIYMVEMLCIFYQIW